MRSQSDFFRRQLMALVTCLAVFVFTGCGGDGNEYPTAYSVTGTVTMDGKPLKALLSFQPVEGSDVPRGGSASSDESGDFEAYYVRWKGLPAGKYKVTASTYAEGDQDGNGGAEETVPEEYRDFDQTPLEITVTEDGGNQFDLAIKTE